MTGRTVRSATILLFLTATLAACGRDSHVAILPDFASAGAPSGPVTVTILPYDPEALRDSLAAVQGPPKPLHPDLMAWFEAYQPPEVADTGPIGVAWRATRDSVQRLADSLRGADRRSPGYRAAYGRFRGLYERFTARSAARNSLYREATAEVRDLAERAGRVADSLRRWEDAAWAGFDTAARLAMAAAGRDSVVLVAQGTEPLEVTLPPGRWWVLARTRVDGNPFLERRWHREIVTAGFPLRVPLDARSAVTAWRH